MDYDEDRIYLSYQNLQSNNGTDNDNLHRSNDDDIESDNVNLHAVKRHFREFLREYFCAFVQMTCL